jgi:hypothetical protein
MEQVGRKEGQETTIDKPWESKVQEVCDKFRSELPKGLLFQHSALSEMSAMFIADMKIHVFIRSIVHTFTCAFRILHLLWTDIMSSFALLEAISFEETAEVGVNFSMGGRTTSAFHR